ncbi:hypothetical protein EV361DRAFT_209266 [Lentinula raphanica]|nr:hypothetical protein EV361DRAFT_209266 [Lentinula raphanica]
MMTESVVAPQSFTGASNFDIANSVFIASTNTTLTSALPQISDASRLSPKPSLFIPPLPSDESEAEWEVYARLLLPRKRGYPLWDPKPREGGLLPEEYRQSGVQIGDVGILNDSGGFDYLFNVCLPPSHPVNAGRVPPNFEQLRGIVVRDTAGDAEKYRPGDYVPSDASHIHKTKITYRAGEQAILGVHKDFGAGVSFKSSATKGAFLILPEGASSIDHQQHTLFYQYAARCARSWYTYVNGPSLARGVHNGSLYLVTGCDKARAWGVASFIGAQPDKVALEFVPREPDRAGGPLEYWFSTCTSALSSSNADNVYKRQSGCVFLRGFKIAVKNPVLAPFSKIAAKVTPLSHLSPDDLLSKPRLSANLATTNATSKQGWLSFLSPSHWTSNLADNGINSEFPIRYEEYHPSNVINNWILSHVCLLIGLIFSA